MSKVQLIWQVDDGYVGASRPKYSDIYLDEFGEDETDEEIYNRLDEIIEQDFKTNVFAYGKNKSDVLKSIREYQKENKEKEDE